MIYAYSFPQNRCKFRKIYEYNAIFVLKLTQEIMRILITNDDGYQAKGIKELADIMKEFGEVTVIAPKHHQSGMSMAVSIGFKQIAHKDFGNGWHYVDAKVDLVNSLKRIPLLSKHTKWVMANKL